jgi:hypothetical protein
VRDSYEVTPPDRSVRVSNPRELVDGSVRRHPEGARLLCESDQTQGQDPTIMTNCCIDATRHNFGHLRRSETRAIMMRFGMFRATSKDRRRLGQGSSIDLIA